MAELMLFITDRAAFSARRLTKDGIIASLAFGYSMWAIAGSGYEVVFKGFMLLMAGIPVYVWVKWRASKDQTPEVELETVPEPTLPLDGLTIPSVPPVAEPV
jgi:APA family basic amino acid/polyamine antiporter